jgi:hypothetical protein
MECAVLTPPSIQMVHHKVRQTGSAAALMRGNKIMTTPKIKSLIIGLIAAAMLATSLAAGFGG